MNFPRALWLWHWKRHTVVVYARSCFFFLFSCYTTALWWVALHDFYVVRRLVEQRQTIRIGILLCFIIIKNKHSATITQANTKCVRACLYLDVISRLSTLPDRCFINADILLAWNDENSKVFIVNNRRGTMGHQANSHVQYRESVARIDCVCVMSNAHFHVLEIEIWHFENCLRIFRKWKSHALSLSQLPEAYGNEDNDWVNFTKWMPYNS